jgi:hypothetical protein
VAPVEPRQLALSDRPGQGELAVGPLFERNMGLAALRGEAAPAEGEQTVKVEMATLDEVLGRKRVGLLKIDVEGHEPAVLRGAQRLLEEGRVRDLVFEDHEPYPSPATQLLEGAGYRLFALDNDLLGIVLLAPQDRQDAPAWPGPSYLATRDPERAVARMRPRWWRTPGILPAPVARLVSAGGNR